MFEELLKGMLAIMLVKWGLNDLPHAAGILGEGSIQPPETEIIPSPKIVAKYRIWRYGPHKEAPLEMHELWAKALSDTKKKYPSVHPSLLTEAKRAEISPREMQTFIAHELWLEERKKIVKQWANEQQEEEEEEED